MRTHYGPWQPCWISNQHQKHKSGRGPSSEHFWQVWLISVQRFQRRRFKCEKLTDGRTLTHDKSSHGLWPGELIKTINEILNDLFIPVIYFYMFSDLDLSQCSYVPDHSMTWTFLDVSQYSHVPDYAMTLTILDISRLFCS